MNDNYSKTALGAINTSCLYNHTNAAIQSAVAAPTPAVVALQIAHLARAGHSVYKGTANSYTVSKFGHSRHCSNFAELVAFAKQVGAKHE